ncbi:vitelline envelope sperm lysin receptor-like [Haliotis rufescens]|uniref:vitelline envelope sperm lysin receptor-like n=1 Tax=Haliotis rufescens TaxID=6454 RepID=UPI00201F839F|nr:vitelline envelope sperm lysin receptor-like [Haliotis rufescens]XP_046328731.2 vitelline envelope sperm lysin receptor-like [Haliotis rufescens]
MLLFLMMIVSVEGFRYHKELAGRYVLELKATCPSKPEGVVDVHVLTDLNLRVRVICKDNFTTLIESDDSVNFHFEPPFRGNSRQECVLNKMAGSKTYTFRLDAEYGEPESEIRPFVEPYIVTCTYDPHSTDKSNKQGIGHSLIAPKEIQANAGKRGASHLKLLVVDVMDKATPRKLKRGLLVSLAASSDGTGGEMGLRATACDAVGNNGVHYAVLRAGCGDGIVFKRTDGFRTDGLNVYSPHFRIFTLKNSVSLRFKCNYTFCSTPCDGSSCIDQAARTKRSAHSPYSVTAVSDSLDLQNVDDSNGSEDGVRDYAVRDDAVRDDADVNYHSLRNTGVSHSTASDAPWWQTPVVILTMAIFLTMLMGGSALMVHRRRMTSASLA